MATRATLSVADVLGELDDAEYESDSEDDFDGYVDTRETTETVEPAVMMDVGANVEVGSQRSSDDGDTHHEYTLQPGCAVPVEGNRPLDYFSLLITEDMLSLRQTFMRSNTSQTTTSLLTPVFDAGPRASLTSMS